MKYFTPEVVWPECREGSPGMEAAALKWKEVCNEYVNQLEAIKHRLSKRFLYIHRTKGHFHDWAFVSYEILQPKRWATDPVKVRIVISDGERQWAITYRQVKRLEVNFTADDDKNGRKWGFETWGYDEITSVDENHLSHEILFASGATLLIHFKNRNLFIEKLKNV